MKNLSKNSQSIIRAMLIWLSFIIFAIFSVMLIALHGKMYFVMDSLFHSNRVLELIKSQNTFPEYALNSFNFDGSSVMTMYPYVFLYPLVIIYKIVGSLKTAFWINFILGTLVALIISYFSSRSYTRNQLTSYVFAMIYGLSGEAMAMYFYSPDSDLGVYFSYLFLPLVIFGFLAYLKRGHWVMLSIGMSMMAYSNVISVVFIAGLLLIWLLCNCSFINLTRIKALIKSALLTVLTTVALWLPMYRLMSRNQLRVPTRSYVKPVILFNLFQHALSNNVFVNCQGLTIYSLVGLVVGLAFFKRLSRFTKQMYMFAILVIFLSTNLFPWNLFSRNYRIFQLARSVQTTIRIMVIPQILLEFVLAFLIAKYIRKHAKPIKVVAMTLFLILLGLTQLTVQGDIVGQHDAVNRFSQVRKAVIRYHVYDYWPQASLSKSYNIYHSKVMNDQNGKAYRTDHVGNGTFHFNLRKPIRRLSLPFFDYYGTSYQVTLDGRSVNTQPSHNQLLTLNNVGSGRHRVHIKIPTAKSTILARILTVVSLPIYADLGLRRYRRKQN